MSDLSGSNDPRGLRVQDDPSWPAVVDALRTYQACFRWERQRQEDGSTPFVPVNLDPAGALHGLELLEAARENLSDQYDLGEVERAIAGQARLQLDGPRFEPGLDVDGRSPWEPHGRPSSVVLDAVHRRTTVDEYRQMIQWDLAHEDHVLLHDRPYVLADEDESHLRRLIDSSLRLEALLIQKGVLPERVPPFRMSAATDEATAYQSPEGELPTWLRELGVTEVVIPTETAPLPVVLTPMVALEQEMLDMKFGSEQPVIEEPLSTRPWSRLDVETMIKNRMDEDLQDLRERYEDLAEEHRGFARVEREVAEGTVWGRLATMLTSNAEYVEWKGQRDTLAAEIAGAPSKWEDVYNRNPIVIRVQRLEEEWSRQTTARALLCVHSGLVEAVDSNGTVPPDQWLNGVGRAFGKKLVNAELHGNVSLSAVQEMGRQFGASRLDRSVQQEPPGIGFI